MVKLPKEMQKRENSKPKRPQAIKKREGQQFASRQIRRRMQQQGVEMDQINATRVIIEGVEKTLIIDQPEVVLMKQMGQEIYQVIGEAQEYSPEDILIGEKEDVETMEFVDESETKPTSTENEEFIAKKGDSYVFDSNEKHGAIIMEDTDVIDVFNPAREDYK
ncbi:unnamed protein product [marine sediment metagenome]|uniref:NAC-A/B domain-containing protein n=1 Tax=marine sediment metagenome TaxID=412755 RepID=X1DWL4_9ZZZZ